MTMLGMIDYGLIVLFFIGVTGLILVIAYAPAHETAKTTARRSFIIFKVGCLSVRSFVSRGSGRGYS